MLHLTFKKTYDLKEIFCDTFDTTLPPRQPTQLTAIMFDDDIDWASFEEDYGIDDYEDYVKVVLPDYLAQSLSSPLVDMPLIKLGRVIGLVTDEEYQSRIRSHSNLKAETWFINETNTLSATIAGPTTTTLFGPQTITGFCNLIRSSRVPAKTPELMLNTSLELSKILTSGLSKWGASVNDRYSLTGILTEIREDDLLMNYYSWYRTLEIIYDIRRAKSSNSDFSVIKFSVEGIKILLHGKFVRFVTKDPQHPLGVDVVGSLDMFLCLLDLVRTRFNTRLACHVLKKPTALMEKIEQQYLWQESCISQYGNWGFEIAKSTEGLWKCWVSRISGGSYASPDSFDRMLDKVRDKEIDLAMETGQDPKKIKVFKANEFAQLAAPVLNIKDAVELFGLMKSCGHPIVNPAAGGKSARDHAKAPDKSHESNKLINIRIFKHLILKNYIKKHGCWPPMTHRKEHRLYRLYKAKVLHIHDGSYPLEDWDYSEVDKIFDFNYNVDYLPLLKDKSCAPPLSKIKEFYSSRNVDRGMRRILQVMLRAPDTDPRELIRQFAEDTLNDDEYCIFLYAKECEHKVRPRMFCMLTFHLRLILSIIQENIKESVFPLLPYQSMILDQVELTKRLLLMTQGSVNGGKETLFIEIDFSRWNLQYRNNHMTPYGLVLDRMFGLSNVFCRAHQVFMRSIVMVHMADQRVPQLEENGDLSIDSDTLWTDHRGGFEGIDQAAWTAATIAMIYSALWDEKCSFLLLGQGDNQTLAITRYRGDKEPLSCFGSRVMAKIEEAARCVNHIAKPDEFVDSTSTLTYSKQFIVNGAIIPMDLKFCSKIGPQTASEIPAFGDAIGGIFSGAVGAAANSADPLRLWLFAVILSELVISRFIRHGGWMGDNAKKTIGSRLKSDKTMRLLLLSIPSILGGIPISTPSKFFCRNEPCPLTAEVAWLRLFACVSKPHSKYISWLFTDEPYYKKGIKLDNLIVDPFSLPFIQPPTQRSLLSELSLQSVKEEASNYDIREAISYANSREEEAFMESLASMSPMYPTLAHDMYKISVFGKTAEIKKMFTLTRTFISRTQQGMSNHQKLQMAELFSGLSVLTRFQQCQSRIGSVPPANISSGTLATNLRKKWKCSSGIVGLSTSHPLDYPFSTDPTQVTGVQAFVKPETSDTSSIDRTKGKFKPYLGSKTMERRVGKTYEVQDAPSARELQKLVLLSTASDFGSGAESLLSYITQTRTRYPLHQLQDIFPRMIGGIVEHRYEMLDSQSLIGPVGNSTLATHISLCTDNIPGLSGGKIDYPVAFQQYFSYLISGIRASHDTDHPLKKAYYTINLSVNNLTPLESTNIDLKYSPKLSVPTRLQNNKILAIEDINLKDTAINRFNPDESLEKLYAPDKLLQEANLEWLLTNLFLAWGAKRGSSVESSIFDEEELVTRKLDVLCGRALGPERLVQATVNAAIILSISHLMRRSDNDDSPTLRYRVCHSYVKMLVSSWIHLAPTIPEIANYLSENQLWFSSVGINGEKTAVQRMNLTLARRVVEKLDYTQKWSWLAKQQIWFSGSTQRTKFDVYFSQLSVILWYIRLFMTERDPLFDRSSDYLVMRKVICDRPQYIPSNFKTETIVHFMVVKLESQLSADMLDLLIPLYQLRTEGVIRVKTSLEEFVRSFRTLPLTVDIPACNKPSLMTEHSDWNVTFKSAPRGGLSVQFPRKLSPHLASTSNRLDYIKERATKFYGITSTAAYNWAHVLSDLRGDDLVGVLGTGSGGIQKYLSDIGISSVGLDLRDTIPLGRLGDYNFQPPEIAGDKLAILSPVAHNTTGDCSEPDVLSTFFTLHPITSLVVDIEKGSQRFGYEVIDWIISSGYRGRIIIKFFLTQEETGIMYSALATLTDQKVRVRALREFQQGGTSPILFSFSTSINKMSVSPEINHVYDVLCTTAPKLPEHLRDERYDILSRLMSDSPVSISPPLEMLKEIHNGLLRGCFMETKDETHMTELTLGFLEIVAKCQTYTTTLDMARYISNVFTKKDYTIKYQFGTIKRSVTINDKYFYSQVLKTIPRIYTAF